MSHYLRNAVIIVALVIGYIQIRSWWRWRTFRRWAKQNGCGETPTVKNTLPGGIERFLKIFKLGKDLDFLEDIIYSSYVEMGCPTYRSHQLFNRSVLTTSEPANIQTVLATKFADFEMATFRRANFGEMLGNGIFTTDGQPWSHYRAQLKPQFTRDQVSDLNAAEHHLGILYSALPAADDDGWTEADLLPLLYRFTMDVSTEFLFGESVNSQATALAAEEKEKAAEDDSFADAMNYAQEFIALRVRFGVLRYLFSTKRFKRACTTVQTFADRFVKIALERDQEKKREDGKYVLLDALVAETRNPVELRDQVLQTLLAGRDTTSAALSWALLLLSRDKGEYAALRGKVLAHFGTAAHPKQDLTFATLKSCKRLAYVLLETLRLYPLIPINGRGAVRDTILPTGGGPHRDQPIAVMKGEQVGYSAYVMHRRRDIWGDDAAAWRPGRWEGRKLGWEFIAFSGGPRVCLGQQYALNEASFVLVRLLQRFDAVEALDMGPGALKKGLTLTLSPANGVNVRLHKAA